MNGPRRFPFPSLPQRPPPADRRPSSIARRQSMARPTTEKVGAPDGWRSKAQGRRMVAGEGGDNGAAGTPLRAVRRAAGRRGAGRKRRRGSGAVPRRRRSADWFLAAQDKAATTGQRVPRSGVSAGPRADGTPGGRRPEAGGALPGAHAKAPAEQTPGTGPVGAPDRGPEPGGRAAAARPEPDSVPDTPATGTPAPFTDLPLTPGDQEPAGTGVDPLPRRRSRGSRGNTGRYYPGFPEIDEGVVRGRRRPPGGR